jgi:hypothetical protein
MRRLDKNRIRFFGTMFKSGTDWKGVKVPLLPEIMSAGDETATVQFTGECGK